MRKVLRLMGTALLLALSAFGTDFSGIWMGQMPGRLGPVDVAFQLTQKGTTLSGKLYGDFRSSPIVEGEVDGEQVSFVIVAPEQSGNQINETRLRFSGCLQGDGLDLTREREGATNAGNAGGVQFRGNAKISFRVKRLI